MTAAEIAEVLGLSGKAVGSIVDRLRREGRHLPPCGPGGRSRDDVDPDGGATAADFAAEFLRRRGERSADVEAITAEEVLRLVSAKVKEERIGRDLLQTQLAERVESFATQISGLETRGRDGSLYSLRPSPAIAFGLLERRQLLRHRSPETGNSRFEVLAAPSSRIVSQSRIYDSFRI